MPEESTPSTEFDTQGFIADPEAVASSDQPEGSTSKNQVNRLGLPTMGATAEWAMGTPPVELLIDRHTWKVAWALTGVTWYVTRGFFPVISQGLNNNIPDNPQDRQIPNTLYLSAEEIENVPGFPPTIWQREPNNTSSHPNQGNAVKGEVPMVIQDRISDVPKSQYYKNMNDTTLQVNSEVENKSNPTIYSLTTTLLHKDETERLMNSEEPLVTFDSGYFDSNFQFEGDSPFHGAVSRAIEHMQYSYDETGESDLLEMRYLGQLNEDGSSEVSIYLQVVQDFVSDGDEYSEGGMIFFDTDGKQNNINKTPWIDTDTLFVIVPYSAISGDIFVSLKHAYPETDFTNDYLDDNSLLAVEVDESGYVIQVRGADRPYFLTSQEIRGNTNSFIRSGPGTNFDILGKIDDNEVPSRDNLHADDLEAIIGDLDKEKVSFDDNIISYSGDTFTWIVVKNESNDGIEYGWTAMKPIVESGATIVPVIFEDTVTVTPEVARPQGIVRVQMTTEPDTTASATNTPPIIPLGNSAPTAVPTSTETPLVLENSGDGDGNDKDSAQNEIGESGTQPDGFDVDAYELEKKELKTNALNQAGSTDDETYIQLAVNPDAELEAPATMFFAEAVALDDEQFLEWYQYQDGDEAKLVRTGIGGPKDVGDYWTLSITRDDVTVDDLPVTEQSIGNDVEALGMDAFAFNENSDYYPNNIVYLGMDSHMESINGSRIELFELVVLLPNKTNTESLQLKVVIPDTSEIGFSIGGSQVNVINSGNAIKQARKIIQSGDQIQLDLVQFVSEEQTYIDAQKYWDIDCADDDICQLFLHFTKEDLFTNPKDIYAWTQNGSRTGFIMDGNTVRTSNPGTFIVTRRLGESYAIGG